MHSPSVPPVGPCSDASLPSTGSRRVLCPRFPGTIKALQLPVSLPATLRCLRMAVPSCARFFAPLGMECNTHRPGRIGRPVPHARISERSRQDLPSSWGIPNASLPMLFDSGRTTHLSPSRDGRTDSALSTTTAPTLVLSKLHHMALRLAVYASPEGSPPHDARLASRCW